MNPSPLILFGLLGLAANALGAALPESLQGFLQQHCLDCHDKDTRKGQMDLSQGPWTTQSLPTLQRLIEVIEHREMPPPKRRGPDDQERQQALRQLRLQRQTLAKASAPASGLRRLTRLEFQHNLQDLLQLPRLDILNLLPADGRVGGYDKIGSALELSPAHFSAYQEAIEKALDAAIATQPKPPPVYRKRVYPAGLFKFGGNLLQGQFVLLKDQQPDPALPVRGGFEDKQGHVGDAGPDLEARRLQLEALKKAGSTSAVGLLNPNLAGYEAAMNVAPIYAGNYRLRLSLWGFEWNQGKPMPGPDQAAVLRAHEEGHQQEGGRLLALFTAASMQSQEKEIVTWLDALESLVFDPVSIPWNGLRIGQVAGRAKKHRGPGVALDWFEIEGPINPSWPPPSHRALFGDLPIAPWPADAKAIKPQRRAPRSLGGYLPSMHLDLSPQERQPALHSVASNQPRQDAGRLLAAFLPKAFRRPVQSAEIEPYLDLLQQRLEAEDCFEEAMRRVYVAVLSSPEFLFLDSGRTDMALASRLSHWLWNGPPDEPLMATAASGKLHQPDVLRAEINRLLDDARSQRFLQDFSDQWLELNRLEETTPDPQLYPEYRFLLHESMAAEPRALLREMLQQDLPITALLEPDFVMLNQRLAEHYEISGPRGVEFTRVPRPAGSMRGGLLGMAAIAKLSANGTTTSPVKRGLWVMDRLLNEPPPPPPPGISQIDPDTRGATTVREQLQRHQRDSNCASCHSRIDPPGFALEALDPIGGLRQRYRSNGKGEPPPQRDQKPWRITYKLGPSVDSSGELRDGRAFQGPADLARLLNADPQRLARALASHLARYACCQDIGPTQSAVIESIVEQTKDKGHGLRSLIHALAQSPLFLRPTP